MGRAYHTAPGVGRRRSVGDDRTHEIVLGRRPDALWRGGALPLHVLRRHLRERQILGEPARGQSLGDAREQREQRASRRVRTRRAAREERRHVRAPERLLQVRRVVVLRRQEDRHAIERDAARRFRPDAARDLDALPRLTGPRS